MSMVAGCGLFPQRQLLITLRRFALIIYEFKTQKMKTIEDIIKKYPKTDDCELQTLGELWNWQIAELEKIVEYKVQQQVNNLSKPDVIKSVCDCGKPMDIKYDPCCSLKCWSEKFESVSYTHLTLPTIYSV